MKIDEVRRILTIGAGTMGHQIGFLCAVNGFDVVVYDVAPDIFEATRKRLAQLADRFVKNGRLPAGKRPRSLAGSPSPAMQRQPQPRSTSSPNQCRKTPS